MPSNSGNKAGNRSKSTSARRVRPVGRNASSERPRKISEGAPTLASLEPAAARWISALIRVTSQHPAMGHILDVVSRLQDRPYRTNITLLGEPGTGKEGLARALHHMMTPERPLVRFDVTGMSEEDALSALCGRGEQPGAAEAADGGALLIEEVARLPLRVQTELLRLLKSGRVRRVGRHADVNKRLAVTAVALSDLDLEAEVRAGRVRHDLYYRLARIVLWLPPLRERLEDIGPAAVWMGNRVLSSAAVPLVVRSAADMKRATDDEKKRSIEISDAAIERLQRHDWRGNFRELEAVMERALLLHREGGAVGPDEIDAAMAGWPARP